MSICVIFAGIALSFLYKNQTSTEFTEAFIKAQESFLPAVACIVFTLGVVSSQYSLFRWIGHLLVVVVTSD